MLKALPQGIRLIFALAAVLLLQSCQPEEGSLLGEAKIFNPVDTSFTTDSLILPAGGAYRYDVLLRQGDPMKMDWQQGLSQTKGSPDLLAFLPINGSSSHGILWLNHHGQSSDAMAANGAGASLVEVFKDSTGQWLSVGLPHAIDFGPIGGTMGTGLGVVTPWGTVLVSEEYEASGLLVPADSSNLDKRNRKGNFGWMLEVDPWKQEVMGIRKGMGRFKHKGALVQRDERTVYLLDADAPSVFFKFVADEARQMQQGQLFAWSMEADSLGRHWLPLTRSIDSLAFARRLALKRGASVFLGLDDIEMMADGSMLITESGMDSANLSQAVIWGGKVMPHLEKFHVGNQVYKDYSGRILRYEPQNEHFSTFLEGGTALENKSIVLSNPDNLAIDHKRQQLFILEDLNGPQAGRVPAWTGNRRLNEVYCLDLSINNPKLDDLRRFAVLPVSARGKGACFNPEASAMFINLDFEAAAKHPIFNKSMTLVISGFPE